MDKAEFNVWDNMPKNIMRYWGVSIPSGESKCFDDNEIIYSDSVYYIRKFQDGPGDDVIVRPPTSGHDDVLISMIHDKSPIESIKKAMPDSSIYSIGYHPAENGNVHIEDLVNHVAETIEYIGGNGAHLIGMCQGGYPLTCLTAIDEAKVLSLHLMASAIDFHAGGGYLYDMVQQFGIKPVQDIIKSNDGIMPGKVLLGNFMMMDPYGRFVGDYLQICNDVIHGREQKLSETEIFRRWYYDPKDTSGGWVNGVNRDLFRDNLLIKKQLKIFGQVADMGKITKPLGVTWGKTDNITVKESARAIIDEVSSEFIAEHALDAGHMGVYVGKKSQPKLVEMTLKLKSASDRHIAKSTSKTNA